MKKKLQLVLLSTDKATNLILDKGKLEFISNKQVANLYGTRSSYTNKVYKCDIGVTDNFILTKEINFPFPENCRKVVITNDNHISLNLGLEKWKAPTNKNYDMVYTRLSPYPTFTNDFLNTYIKKYNDGEVLEFVEVEYDCDHFQMPNKVIDVLKVNTDNTVDVSLIEDKLYTKEEVIDFISDFVKCKEGLNQNFDIEDYQKWITKNL